MRKVFFSFVLVIIILCSYLYLNRTHITFIDQEVHISLNDEIKPYEYIKQYHHLTKDDIQINSSVNNEKCGEYIIEYKYQKKIQKLKVYVDDTIAPTFDIKNKKIFLNEIIDPNDLVENIKDQTNTTVYFYKDYIFNEEKTYKVEVVVEDEYANTTKKTAYILVEKEDKEAPTLEGLTTLEVIKGQTVDLKKDIIKKDDHDSDPILTIDDSSLDINTEGEYIVYYTVKDSFNNRTTYTRKVIVKSPYSNIEAKKDGVKTCYLTFDDGPSYNTEKVLKILKQYNIKATFFVTGTHSDSYQYLKQIVDEGHTIGLHTYSHDYEEIYTSLANYMKDLKKIKELVKEKTGIDCKYIRFPGGSSNLVSKKYNVGIMKRLTKKVIDEGYQYYDWTCVNGDGENVKTVSGLIKKAKEEIGDLEDIMFLMHDGSQNDITVKALPTIIEYLINQGYEFKVVDDNSPTFHHSVQN
jgi:peptidoglycan/xylan/chitin deacetylase (PgdA/CDA1 family)